MEQNPEHFGIFKAWLSTNQLKFMDKSKDLKHLNLHESQNDDIYDLTIRRTAV